MYGCMYYLNCSSCGVKSAENPHSQLKLPPEVMFSCFSGFWFVRNILLKIKYTFWKAFSIYRSLRDCYYQTVVPGSVKRDLKQHVGE